MQNSFPDRISYLIVDTSQYGMAQHALKVSQHQFPLSNRIVFSDRADGWDATKFIQIPKIQSIAEYNELLLAEAWRHVDTDFVQIIQWDGHVINPKAFRPQFLEFDYIGAVWPHRKVRRVGNGGFSLRSKKLMTAVHSLLPDFANWQQAPEDELICRTMGERLETEFGVHFANGLLARHYSVEWDFDLDDLPFGFHGLAMLIAEHQNNIAGLLNQLEPISGWQLRVISQLISSLEEQDIAAFYSYLQRHNLFDEFAKNLNIKIESVR